MGEIKAAMAAKVVGARTAKPEDSVSHDIRKYATWPQQDGQPEGYRKRPLDSDDEDELALLPVDQRAAARSAKVIRRYVPSADPKRTTRPPEDPMRIQAWLGRVIPVPAHPLQAPSSKAAAKAKEQGGRQAEAQDRTRQSGQRRTLDQWLRGMRPADTEVATPAASSSLTLQQASHRQWPLLTAPSTSTKASRGGWKTGKRGHPAWKLPIGPQHWTKPGSGQ